MIANITRICGFKAVGTGGGQSGKQTGVKILSDIQCTSPSLCIKAIFLWFTTMNEYFACIAGYDSHLIILKSLYRMVCKIKSCFVNRRRSTLYIA